LTAFKDQLEFSLTHIFQEESTQDEIFQKLAKPVIDNGLEGYNGTIFAYGQTGSGKTYAMSGGDEW
jgi:kinesin family protein 6/9